ncbi:hypothetical protein [Halorhabdus salina]|nr:hypothetical protein [Halorhabdus salina]
MSNVTDRADVDDDHLTDIEDGCGCAEIWEGLSEQRIEPDDD